MSITVRYFANLREEMGRSVDRLDTSQSLSVAEVWAQATDQLPLPTNILCAVNMEYVNPAQLVKDGDEVAFFPPVTGG